MAKELYKAIVSKNNDDLGRGRIKVKCQALVGVDKELPGWVEPIVPFCGDGFGWFAIPEPDDEVELELNISDRLDEVHGEALLVAPQMRYRATAYSKGTAAPDAMKRKRVGLVTRAGHVLFFHDEEGKEEVRIQASFGKAKPTLIKLTKDQITIENADAHMDVKVKSCDLIDGADTFMVRGVPLKDWLNNTQQVYLGSHTHTAGTLAVLTVPATGTTGPPVTPPPTAPDSILSTVAKLKLLLPFLPFLFMLG